MLTILLSLICLALASFADNGLLIGSNGQVHLTEEGEKNWNFETVEWQEKKELRYFNRIDTAQPKAQSRRNVVFAFDKSKPGSHSLTDVSSRIISLDPDSIAPYAAWNREYTSRRLEHREYQDKHIKFDTNCSGFTDKGTKCATVSVGLCKEYLADIAKTRADYGKKKDASLNEILAEINYCSQLSFKAKPETLKELKHAENSAKQKITAANKGVGIKVINFDYNVTSKAFSGEGNQALEITANTLKRCFDADFMTAMAEPKPSIKSTENEKTATN